MRDIHREAARRWPLLNAATRPLLFFALAAFLVAAAFATTSYGLEHAGVASNTVRYPSTAEQPGKGARGGAAVQVAHASALGKPGVVVQARPGQSAAAPTHPSSSDSDWRKIGKELSHRRILVFAIEQLTYIITLAFIVFSGIGARWWKKLSEEIQRPRLARVIYLIGALILLGIVGLPFDLWRYRIDRAFDLSNQSLTEWLRDYTIAGATGLVIGVGVLLGIYWLIRRRPRTWWRWTAAAAVPLIALALFAGPYYAYLFNRFTPLKDKQLSNQVLALASRAGVSADVVYETDLSRQTRAANAYVAGFGASKRLVLADTLIQNFTPQQVLFVTAHELGHYVMNHILIGFGFAVVGTVIMLFLLQRIGEWVVARFRKKMGIETSSDPPGLFLGILVVLLISIVAMPAANAFSRNLEHRADAFAARTTIPDIISREQAADAFERLGRLDLSDPDPNAIIEFVFWDHPPLDKREQFVLSFRSQK